MIDMNVPLEYWEYAIQASVYLLNRSPTVSLDGKTPYEVVFGDKPDISNLVPFYSLGVVHITKEEREHTLTPKGKRCRMLGYADDYKNCYILLVEGTEQIIIRRDVKFINEKEIIINKIDKSKLDFNPYWSEVDIDPYWKDSNETNNCSERLNAANTIIELPNVPKNLEEAKRDPNWDKWKEAYQKEMDAFTDRGTFELADDQNGPAMGSKVIFKVRVTQSGPHF
jgi:hypothetical protein